MTPREMRETTIARNYAEALFALGEQSGRTEEYGELIQALAAVLWAGPDAVASHATAARLWGISDMPHGLLVWTPQGRSARVGVVVHRGLITGNDRRIRDRVPVTSPGRTLIDLGDEQGAVDWLVKQKKVEPGTRVRDYGLDPRYRDLPFLRPGAVLVLETINAACWAAFFDSYIRDFTHARPLHPETLKFLVQASGFGSVEIQFRSPFAEHDRLPGVALPTAPVNSPGLPTNRLTAVHEDGRGRLWLQSERSHLIERRADGFVDRTPAVGGGPVHAVHVDAGGGLWAGTATRVYRLADTVFAALPLELEAPVLALLLDSRDVLWIGTARGGLYTAPEGGRGRAARIEGLGSTNVHRLVAGPAGDVWIGLGDRIEVSLLSSSLGAMVNQAQSALQTHQVPRMMGNQHPSIAPYETLRCEDAFLAVAVGNDAQWRRLCAALGEPARADEPKPVPLTRDEMKKALDDLKGRTPRIPLPPLTKEEREKAGRRDVCLYVRDPHVLVGRAPHELFVDPSYTYRLWLHHYRPPRELMRAVQVRMMTEESAADAINRIYAACGMLPAPSPVLRENQHTRTFTYLVAEDAETGDIIGTVTGIDHRHAFEDPEDGTSLWCLAVDPQTTRPGVGVALVDTLAERFQARGRAFLDQLLERVQGLPGVHSASFADTIPLNLGGQRGFVRIEGYTPQPGEDMELNFAIVGPRYFETLRIPIRRGRALGEQDRPGASGAVVINEALARRYWPGQEPLGKKIRRGPAEFTVVGVAQDGKYRSLGEEPLPFTLSFEGDETAVVPAAPAAATSRRCARPWRSTASAAGRSYRNFILRIQWKRVSHECSSLRARRKAFALTIVAVSGLAGQRLKITHRTSCDLHRSRKVRLNQRW